MNLTKLVENSNLDNLYRNPGCHVLLRIFSMSKNTAAIDMLLLKLRVTWSVSLMHCSAVLWRARKTNWLELSRPLSCICFWRVFRITFSNSLPVLERTLIGHKFWGNFWSLRCYGNVMNFAFFQDFGKWDSRRQWLNKCIKCTNGRLGRYLMYSFVMPSTSRNLLNSVSHMVLFSLRACFLRLRA
jgi:hypothetical protein